MATVKLVKSIYTGSDVTSLGELASGDSPDLGTPASGVLTNCTGYPNVLLGDGTTGRVDRSIGFNIEPGATPGTNINIAYLSALSWNAPLTSDATNLAASGTSGSFALSADGKTITYNPTPNIIAINSITIVRSKLNTASATTYYVYPGLSSGNLLLQIEPHGTPGIVDWRTILNSGDVLRIFISMKTDS
jgi:hypothetical protein